VVAGARDVISARRCPRVGVQVASDFDLESYCTARPREETLTWGSSRAPRTTDDGPANDVDDDEADEQLAELNFDEAP
jgi:hypothetical protein